MKKMITSVGLAALGAASLSAQTVQPYAPQPGLTAVQTSKPWSISVSLRGFYDDNYTTLPSDRAEESFGIEVSPTAAFNWTLERTYIGISYTYSMKWYEDRPEEHYDHTHIANLKLSHVFNERYKVDLSDSFVIAQEPEILEHDGPVTTPLRSEGDNLRNVASINFNIELTQQFGLLLGYANTIYDYDQDGAGSYSALLDRMEHLGTINLRWQVQPASVVILGYQYGDNDYNGKDLLAPGSPFDSDHRDNRTHYAYVGLDQAFNPQLSGSIRVGAQVTDFYEADQDETNPYADANMTWTYNPQSWLQVGVRHTRAATDVSFIPTSTEPNLDQELTSVYASWNHRLTGKLTGSILGQYQHASFQDEVDDETENLFLAGVNLSYQINQFLAAETGYNFDRLDSDLPNRSYTRNRVYIGIRASY
jgi:hypothetical protein